MITINFSESVCLHSVSHLLSQAFHSWLNYFLAISHLKGQGVDQSICSFSAPPRKYLSLEARTALNM